MPPERLTLCAARRPSPAVAASMSRKPVKMRNRSEKPFALDLESGRTLLDEAHRLAGLRQFQARRLGAGRFVFGRAGLEGGIQRHDQETGWRRRRVDPGWAAGWYAIRARTLRPRGLR